MLGAVVAQPDARRIPPRAARSFQALILFTRHPVIVPVHSRPIARLAAAERCRTGCSSLCAVGEVHRAGRQEHLRLASARKGPRRAPSPVAVIVASLSVVVGAVRVRAAGLSESARNRKSGSNRHAHTVSFWLQRLTPRLSGRNCTRQAAFAIPASSVGDYDTPLGRTAVRPLWSRYPLTTGAWASYSFPYEQTKSCIASPTVSGITGYHVKLFPVSVITWLLGM